MKKFYLILAVAFLNSCSKSPTIEVENNLKEYMEENANDPSSYEQVSTVFIDTLFSQELAQSVLYELEKDLVEAEDKLGQAQRELKRTTGILESGEFPEHRKTYESLHESNKVILRGYRSTRDFYADYVNQIKDFSQRDSILFFQILHRARLKNGYGALSLEDYFVIVNPEFEILHITTDQTENSSFVRKEFINTAVK